MGLFSKLFKNADEAASKIFKDAIDGTFGTDSAVSQKFGEKKRPDYEKLWENEIPKEENQFNFEGTYYEYFDHIFKEEFPEFVISNGCGDVKDSWVFTFWREYNRALVVEILPENSSSAVLRRQCEYEGMAYLRFYHNHKGWWNTRNYVITRTRRALGEPGQ